MASFYNMYTQAFPPKARFTESRLSSLEGKVYVVTGSNTGVGKELAQILYSRGAHVFVCARSEQKSLEAISSIQKKYPSSSGVLDFVKLDLADLTTIKKSAQAVLAKTSRIDVLFNNAGVMNPAQGSKTAQGYELQLGVNNIGTFLFTKLLTPFLISTATTLTPGSVRIVWVGSSAAELQSPKHGVPMTLIADRTSYLKNSPFYCYSVSKAGNFYHATEAARRLKSAGVVSVALNPGNLASELWRTQGSFADWLLRTFVLYPAVNGAYTELFAGLAEDVGAMLLAGNDVSTNSVTWVIPFGRIGTVSRKDMVTGTRTREEGGSGVAKDFWEWTEKQIEQYT